MFGFQEWRVIEFLKSAQAAGFTDNDLRILSNVEKLRELRNPIRENTNSVGAEHKLPIARVRRGRGSFEPDPHDRSIEVETGHSHTK